MQARSVSYRSEYSEKWHAAASGRDSTLNGIINANHEFTKAKSKRNRLAEWRAGGQSLTAVR
jgi:hypothetical protein